MRAYLLFTAPRGYLSFSPLHCECHSDTRIPQSTGPDPHPLHRKALTPHLHTWGGRSQNLRCCIKIRGDVDASYTTYYINLAACCNTETKCLLVFYTLVFIYFDSLFAFRCAGKAHIVTSRQHLTSCRILATGSHVMRV